MIEIPANIILSRTDSIGDVVLTLPVAAILKQNFPGLKIAFLGRDYTRPVIEACKYIDEFIDLEDFLQKEMLVGGEKPVAILHVFPNAKVAARAKDLRIPIRIGTANRIFHWVTCNKLVKLSRKNSSLHEAQLNLKLLKPFGIEQELSLQQIIPLFGLEKLKPLPAKFEALISQDKYRLILHPKSQGSAREWGLDNFIQLIKSLDKTHYKVFISGTSKERTLLEPLFKEVGHLVTDLTGQMTLDELVAFIAQCNGLVANSTGPLHVAAILGKDAFGIYPPMRPIHPGRWAPIGSKVKVFVLDKFCEDCRSNPKQCSCIRQIQPAIIREALDKAAAIQ